MQVIIQRSVLLFAGLRQRAGRSSIDVEISEGATVAQLLEQLAHEHPALGPALSGCRVAVDQSFVGPEDRISPGEIAIIPPVSGGHDGEIVHQGDRSLLTNRALDLAAVIEQVSHRSAGGINTFTGNVREHSRGKTVEFLEYEAYAPMAVREMDRIALAVEAELPGTKVALQHRVGRLEIGETAVVIAASAAHRAEAFEACRAVIERLKEDVPIWKREVDTEGEGWIGQGP